AGVLVSTYYGIAHYTMGASLGLKAFCAAVLGGIGNLPGAMLGGLVLGVVEALGAGYIGDLTDNVFGSNYQDVFAFIVLIFVLVARPSGLLGERVGARAWGGAGGRRVARALDAPPRRALAGRGDDRGRTHGLAVRAHRAIRHGLGADHEPRDPLHLPRPGLEHRGGVR